MAAHVVDEDGDRLFGIEYELPSAPSTAVGEDVSAARPHAPALLENYPNPFNPGTTIRFDVAQTGALRLAIFDAAGQRLRMLVDATHNAGQYEYHWDGRDGGGFNVASGAYFAVLQAGRTRQSKMMTLIR